jgi:hypothetical protein
MGMLPLTYLPSLFFRVMDRRLLAQADGGPGRLNVRPAASGRLERRYGAGASSPK